MKRILLATALLALAALAAAGCGGSSTTTVTTTATQTVTTPAAATGTDTSTTGTDTSTTGTDTSTTGTGTGTTPTSVAGTGACRAADLTLSYLGQQGATGHGELGFTLRNKSGGACTTFGYPGVLFLDRAGRALPTRTSRTTSDFFGNTTLRHIKLAPGDTVSFRVGVTHEATAGDKCTTAHQLQVIAPNDTATMRVQISQGGAYECAVATISPVEAGNSAYP